LCNVERLWDMLEEKVIMRGRHYNLLGLDNMQLD